MFQSRVAGTPARLWSYPGIWCRCLCSDGEDSRGLEDMQQQDDADDKPSDTSSQHLLHGRVLNLSDLSWDVSESGRDMSTYMF